MSRPKIDLGSIDFDAELQEPYISWTPGDPKKDDYESSIIDCLGCLVIWPEQFADLKAYARYLLRELDKLDKTVER